MSISLSLHHQFREDSCRSRVVAKKSPIRQLGHRGALTPHPAARPPLPSGRRRANRIHRAQICHMDMVMDMDMDTWT